MRCERCGSDTSVAKHSVDGFTGYLCGECQDVWSGLLESNSPANPTP